MSRSWPFVAVGRETTWLVPAVFVLLSIASATEGEAILSYPALTFVAG